MTKQITVWEGGIKHAHKSIASAAKRYRRLSRCGVPTSIYIDGVCCGAANGDGSVVSGSLVA